MIQISVKDPRNGLPITSRAARMPIVHTSRPRCSHRRTSFSVINWPRSLMELWLSQTLFTFSTDDGCQFITLSIHL